jgi:hypothetical protein
LTKAMRSTLVVAFGLLLVGCGNSRGTNAPGGASGSTATGGSGGSGGGGFAGAGGAMDGGTDAPPDSGPVCNPDSGAGSWRLLGALLGASTSNAVELPTMALLPDGSPVVAWTTAPATTADVAQTYTERWTPSGCDGAWAALGPPLAGVWPALMAPVGGDQPVRAWLAADQSAMTVERWNGTAFEALGAPFQTQNRYIGSPVMVADASGNPILAWIDGANTTAPTVQVAHWNGTAWVMLSSATGVLGLPAPGGTPRALSLALTPDGLPVLAWPTTSYVTTVAKFVSGTTWTMLGTPPAASAGSGSVNGPIVRINGAGDIFIASIARAASVFQVSAARFDGSAWQPLGGPLVTAGAAEDYDMTVDGSGAPIVADSEFVMSEMADRLFTYRWDGATWQAPAPGETAAPPPQVYVANPTIAVDPRGRLVAAWLHRTTGTAAIAVARYQP